MVGLRILVPPIGVRIPVPQPEKKRKGYDDIRIITLFASGKKKRACPEFFLDIFPSNFFHFLLQPPARKDDRFFVRHMDSLTSLWSKL